MILLSGIFSYISNQLNSVSNISLNLRDGIRLIGVFVCFSSIILSRNEISVKLIKFIIFTTLAIGLITSFLKENIIIAGINRIYPFSTGIHTSAYTIALIILLLIYFRKVFLLSNITLFILIVVSIYLLYGYNVRSSYLLLFICFISEIFFGKTKQGNLKIFLLINFIILVFLTILFLNFDINDNQILKINEFSSGRVFNLFERINLFIDRDLFSKIVGSGSGSDLIYTSVWWWEEKDSHNDVFKFLWEYGVLGLFSLLLWFVIIIRLSPNLFPIVISIYTISLISNGLLTRPSISFLLFSIMALSINRSYLISNKNAQ